MIPQATKDTTDTIFKELQYKQFKLEDFDEDSQFYLQEIMKAFEIDSL